jgi:serine/threonine protein kinase
LLLVVGDRALPMSISVAGNGDRAPFPISNMRQRRVVHQLSVHQKTASKMAERTNSRVDGNKKMDSRNIVGQYEIIKTIGEGNFARVKLATHILTNTQVNFSYFICILQQAMALKVTR